MELRPLGDMTLTYVGPSLDFVDYGVGGQYYAAMEGSWRSDRISGTLRLTNLAQKRSDTINTPALRGVMQTEDGAAIYVEMNGLSQIQEGGRVFIASMTLRTAAPRYLWLNTLFAVVEGELHGAPRPNEFHARCRVYACEATISPKSTGGTPVMRVNAFVLPVLPGKEAALEMLGREVQSSREADRLSRSQGLIREVAFMQRTPMGSQLLIYNEAADTPPTAPDADQAFERQLNERLGAIIGFDPAAGPQPKVELLIREPAPQRGPLYLAALPLRPGKTARVHEFASELNGIHAGEFQESLRRLGFGLTFFVQHTPQVDLAISVIEGDDPAAALGRLATSSHPFDRWHIQQIADQTGLDLSSPPPPPNLLLWSWEGAEAAVPEAG